MKYNIKAILLICLLGFNTILSQPWTHGFKDYFITEGYVDHFSLYHAGIGGVKTVVNEGFWALNTRYGWMEEPSSIAQSIGNLALAVLWEVGEFGIEGNWDYKYYCDFYGGEKRMWRNNVSDIVLDQICFMIPHYVGIYYDLKIWKHGISIGYAL